MVNLEFAWLVKAIEKHWKQWAIGDNWVLFKYSRYSFLSSETFNSKKLQVFVGKTLKPCMTLHKIAPTLKSQIHFKWKCKLLEWNDSWTSKFYAFFNNFDVIFRQAFSIDQKEFYFDDFRINKNAWNDFSHVEKRISKCNLIIIIETNSSGENQFSRLRNLFGSKIFTYFCLNSLSGQKSLRCFGCRFNLNLMSDAWVFFVGSLNVSFSAGFDVISLSLLSDLFLFVSNNPP